MFTLLAGSIAFFTRYYTLDFQEFFNVEIAFNFDAFVIRRRAKRKIRVKDGDVATIQADGYIVFLRDAKAAGRIEYASANLAGVCHFTILFQLSK
jgi:hypothetical protein